MDAEKLFTILREDRQESEQRMREQMSAADLRMRDMEARLNKTVDELKADFKDVKTSVQNTNRWIMGISITTILAIAAMVISTLLSAK